MGGRKDNKITTTHNSTYKKLGAHWLNEAFPAMAGNILLRIKFFDGRQFCACLLDGRQGNRQLFVAPNR